MQERRVANRFRTNVNVRWETLRSQGRGEVCDLSPSGCFVLAGGQLAHSELVRLDLVLSRDVVTAWGYVVYAVAEMGFAVRFVFADNRGRQNIERIIESINRQGRAG